MRCKIKNLIFYFYIELIFSSSSHSKKQNPLSRCFRETKLEWPLGETWNIIISSPNCRRCQSVKMKPKTYLKSYQSKVKCMSFKIWETQYIISVFSLYQTLNCCLDPCSLTLLHIYFLTVMIIQGKLSKRSPLLNIL